MTISRQALDAFLDRERQSYTWIKKLRREKLLAELSHFRVPPRFKTQPWVHQLACFLIGMSEPRFLYLLDMGLGKSKIIMDLITHRLRCGDLDRALVTVPNIINMQSWYDDIDRHSDLEPQLCDIPDTDEKWERIAYPRGDVTIIDYQGLALALCTRKNGKKGRMVPDASRLAHLHKVYNFLAADESHKLGNHDSLWFELLLRLGDRMDYVYSMTGTAFGRTPETIWSQFRITDGGETFGENIGLFRSAFFTAETSGWSTKWKFRRRLAPELHRMMQHRSLRYDEREVPEIDLPKRMPTIVKRLRMSEEQREHHLRAVEKLVQAEGLADRKELDAPWMRMRQIASGYVAWHDETGEHVVRFKDNPKLACTEGILDELGANKIVICHFYTETGRMLCDMLKARGIKYEWLHGGTKDKVGARQRFIDDPECQVFVMNTEAGGTGNDGLQKVAHYMLMYETPTPPDVRRQVEKRIDRPGQQHRCFFIDLVLIGSMDQSILDNIAEGRDVFEEVVNGRARTQSLVRY